MKSKFVFPSLFFVSAPGSVRALLVPAMFAASAGSVSACSVCGCSLSSDWAAQGYPQSPGWHAEVRYEYSRQDQLRAGAEAVSRGSLAIPNAEEVQVDTTNRTVWLNLDYVGGDDWGVGLQLPYIDRTHATFAEGDTALSTSDAAGLGDARVLGHRQWEIGAGTWGTQLGLKLPTGGYDQTFSSGPQAGALLDRGLQLGSGTTGLQAGVSWFGLPTDALGLFAQLFADQPLGRRAGFAPSASLTLTGGLRWLNPTRFTPQLQVNTRWESRERGPRGDSANSGGSTVSLAPGVTIELVRRVEAFGFVQVPVYQNVNGLQLEPRWLLSLGVRYRL